MVKLMGLFLAFMAASAAGFYQAATFQQRKKLLVDVQSLLLHIATEISYFKEPLPQIFQRLSQGDDRESHVLLRSVLTSYTVENRPLPQLWACAVDTVYGPSALNREDMALLKTCGAFLGQSDFKGQKDHFQLLDRQLDKQIAEAEEMIRTKGRMYARLGVFAGLVLVVTLL